MQNIFSDVTINFKIYIKIFYFDFVEYSLNFLIDYFLHYTKIFIYNIQFSKDHSFNNNLL